MMRISRAALCVAFVLLSSLGASRVAAQVNATGTFSGQVTDQSGAAIGDATVKVTEQQTGISVTRRTAADGIYTIPLLKPGVYAIEAGSTGFASVTRKHVTLQIQQVAQEDFKLQVGGVDQQVTVEGAAAGQWEAHLLDIALASPLLRLDSVAYLADGRPFEYSQALHNGARTSVEVKFYPVLDEL